MSITNVHDAKTRLSQLIERALAGEEVIIARAGTPVERLVPYEGAEPDREGGQRRGRVHIAEDIDELPEEVGEAFRLREI